LIPRRNAFAQTFTYDTKGIVSISLEENKLLATRAWEEIWNQGHLSRIDEIFASNFVRHDVSREWRGREPHRQFIRSLRTAFSDLCFTVDDWIAEGDKVVIRCHFQGTQHGTFEGFPATGKQVTSTGLLLQRIVDGNMAEQWAEVDLLGLLRQLGVVPA
jgi:steroid delta-isomerase-like uncharacterized protein